MPVRLSSAGSLHAADLAPARAVLNGCAIGYALIVAPSDRPSQAARAVQQQHASPQKPLVDGGQSREVPGWASTFQLKD
jgi:hypothetical protein